MLSKKNHLICTGAVLSLTVFLMILSKSRAQGMALAERIAPQILRFHVLANSDSPEDQALKLEVRDLLLNELSGAEYGSSSATKREISGYILTNRSDLEAQAETFIASRGFDYKVSIRLEQCEFPDRTYGDLSFPAGTYDAVRVLIGEGAGKNYWCVLYPSLCYLDSTHAVVTEDSKEQLRAVIPEDDFLALLSARRLEAKQKAADSSGSTETVPRLTIRFKLFDWLQGN